MTYYPNALHTPVRPKFQSTYSSLTDAVKDPKYNGQFKESNRNRVPQDSYAVLRKIAVPAHKLLPRVSFDVQTYTQQGVPMREITHRSSYGLAQIIVGPNDLVFYHSGLSRIILRILWPGYHHVEWAGCIELNTQTGPMTRIQLAVAISQQFYGFIEKCKNAPNDAGIWRLGPSGIGYQSLILVALWNVSGDNWQADVAIDMKV